MVHHAYQVHGQDGCVEHCLETDNEIRIPRAGGLRSHSIGRVHDKTFSTQEDRKDRMAIVDVKTEITGNVWKIVARVGQKLAEDEPILILESMKMEIPVSAPEAGTVKEILVAEGDVVTEGSVVARIEA